MPADAEPLKPLDSDTPKQAVEPTVLIVNTRARSGERQFRVARELLQARGVRLENAVAVKRPDRMRELVRSALKDGARRIIAGGGDGTFSCLADELAFKDVTLGVLPLGTGNDFARGLGIPLDLAGACDVVSAGRAVRVDLGRVNGRHFLNAISVGLTTKMTRKLNPKLKRAGPLAYLVAAASVVGAHRPFRVTITSDALTVRLKVLQLVVGNGRYHGAGLLIAPGAQLYDGRLDLYAIGAVQETEAMAEVATFGKRLKDVWTLARVASGLRSGRHVDDRSVYHLRVAKVTVEADPVHEIDVDGELRGETPVSVDLAPGALRVLGVSEGPQRR